MNIHARRLESGALVSGLMMIALGTLFLFDRMGIADFGSLVRYWWPMFLIFLGVSKLFRRETVWSGLWLIAIGAWFEAVQLHLFGLSWRSSWPLLLIVFGAGMVIRALIDAAPRVASEDGRDS